MSSEQEALPETGVDREVLSEEPAAPRAADSEQQTRQAEPGSALDQKGGRVQRVAGGQLCRRGR